MNLEDLRAVRSRERASDSLQDLRDSFYEEVAAYIESRKEDREQAAAEADDPFGSEEVQTLTDEIETAEQVAEAIYERRMGKLVKQASLAAAGMSSDTEGLTNEERRLYEDLVTRIEENKSHVLDVLSGDAEPTSDTSDSSTEPTEAEHANPDPPEPTPVVERDESPQDSASEPSSAAAAMGGSDAGSTDTDSTDAVEDGGSTDADGGDAESRDRTRVRVTQDVGEVFGVDERQYSLEADDVVTLPAENAKPLVEKDAAEEL